MTPALKHCRSHPSPRMTLFRLIAAVLLLTPASPITQAGAGPTDDPATLIRQLNHGKLAVRDAAVDGLLACGPMALPAIERALPNATGEAAFRLPLLAEAIAIKATQQLLDQPPADAAAPATATGPFSMAVQQVAR